MVAEAEVADCEFAGVGGVVARGGAWLACGIHSGGSGGDAGEIFGQPGESIEHGGEKLRFPNVVRIQKGDEWLAGLADARVARGGKARVFLPDVAHAGVGEGGDHGAGVVRRAVVHDQKLER